MSNDLVQLLRRIEANTTRSLAAERETVRIGSFLAAFHPKSDMIWMNYAVPVAQTADPAGLEESLHGLREAFRARNRTLRFEYIEAIWPDLADSLERFGLQLQGKMPLMLCAPSDLRRVERPEIRVTPLEAAADQEVIREFIAIGKRAFGMSATDVTKSEVDEHRESLLSGFYHCALGRFDGQAAGVGTMNLGNDELVGVGTLPEYRRQGVAAAVSSFVVAEHFSRGAAVVWLSAGDDAAVRLYEKIGFHSAGAQLHYMDTPPT